MSRTQTQLLAAILYFGLLVAAAWFLNQHVSTWMIVTLAGTFAAAYVIGSPASFLLPLRLIPGLQIASGQKFVNSFPDQDGTIFHAANGAAVWVLMFAAVGLCEVARRTVENREPTSEVE